jgi:phage recombination protein Bet
MNSIAQIDAPAARRSITETMAHRFGMESNTFLATLSATVFAKGMTREEQAAFLLVADHHNLNPVTREIYAMPKKGGGIIPVVSIDGWIRMSNEHPAFDGMDFEDQHEGEKLISTTCRIFRKDRSRPIVVTEYLSECFRETEPWKMKHRMLRHKAMIQCARYAFGFAGIYDQDEAERFAATEIERNLDRRRAPPPALENRANYSADPEPTRQIAQSRRAPPPPPEPEEWQSDETGEPLIYGAIKLRYLKAANEAQDEDSLEAAWRDHVEHHYDRLAPADQEDILTCHRRRTSEIVP